MRDTFSLFFRKGLFGREGPIRLSFSLQVGKSAVAIGWLGQATCRKSAINSWLSTPTDWLSVGKHCRLAAVPKRALPFRQQQRYFPLLLYYGGP